MTCCFAFGAKFCPCFYQAFKIAVTAFNQVFHYEFISFIQLFNAKHLRCLLKHLLVGEKHEGIVQFQPAADFLFEKCCVLFLFMNASISFLSAGYSSQE